MLRKCVKRIAQISACVLLMLIIWGMGIEPRLVDIREETAIVPNLPAAWEGVRIVLIADLQIGMWFGNEDTTAKIVSQIIENRPAAVLIAGDFVYKPTDEDETDEVERADAVDFMKEVNESVALISPLVQANIPTYAVLGNHDYGMNYPDSVKNARLAAVVRQNLEAIGVRVLDNAAVPLTLTAKNNAQNSSVNTDGAVLYAVGIGSHYAGNDKPAAALSQVPENTARIIFMHEPDIFAAFPAGVAPLALAGHTHGGQIRIPFAENWSWMSLLTEEKIHSDGWIDNFGQSGNRLYVNRGIGFSSFPVRINCRPELTYLTLRGK